MIGKLLEKTRSAPWAATMKMTLKTNYDITQATKNVSSAGLPQAPANPFKKRPLKLKYDKNEF